SPIQTLPAELVKLEVNGQAIDPVENMIYQNAKGVYMIPLRQTAELLDYEVKWNQQQKVSDVSKGNHLHILKIGADRYNINKMLIQLGTAPEMNGEKTFVPLTFFSDVLKVKVSFKDKTISISNEQLEAAPIKQGTITEIRQDKQGGEININGFLYGIRLAINDQTEIVTTDNKKLAFADLKPGMVVEATHASIMTMSIPPLSSAFKIVVKETAPELLATMGEISEIRTNEDGSKTLSILKGQGLNSNGYESVVLHLSADTKLINAKDNSELDADQLKQGQRVIAFYGPMMTRSMPPQGGAVKILVEVEEKAEQNE
ncbi:MAG: copper amine oxidase N-terminal domain-containing protein, partial [Clostridia bacterium]